MLGILQDKLEQIKKIADIKTEKGDKLFLDEAKDLKNKMHIALKDEESSQELKDNVFGINQQLDDLIQKKIEVAPKVIKNKAQEQAAMSDNSVKEKIKLPAKIFSIWSTMRTFDNINKLTGQPDFKKSVFEAFRILKDVVNQIKN